MQETEKGSKLGWLLAVETWETESAGEILEQNCFINSMLLTVPECLLWARPGDPGL
jgi:hypothetical protein